MHTTTNDDDLYVLHGSLDMHSERHGVFSLKLFEIMTNLVKVAQPGNYLWVDSACIPSADIYTLIS